MIRKLLWAVAVVAAAAGVAFAAPVDVNKADAKALDAVQGLGPAKAKAIVDERSKNGEFKDWADFEQRVKGIGGKAAARLSKAGLVVNGKAKEGGAAADSKPAKAAKPAQ